MKHVVDLLPLLMDEEADSKQKTGIEKHLRSCTSCSRAYQALVERRELLKAWKDKTVSGSLSAGILNKVRPEAARQGLRVPFLERLRLVLLPAGNPIPVMASVILFALAIGVVWNLIRPNIESQSLQQAIARQTEYRGHRAGSTRQERSPRIAIRPNGPAVATEQKPAPQVAESKQAAVPFKEQPQRAPESAANNSVAALHEVSKNQPASNNEMSNNAAPRYAAPPANVPAPKKAAASVVQTPETNPTSVIPYPAPAYGHTQVRDNVLSPNGAQKALIDYVLDVDSAVSVKVFNATGDLVVVLVEGPQQAGVHQVTWGGANAATQAVASGTYYVTIQTSQYKETKKVVVVR